MNRGVSMKKLLLVFSLFVFLLGSISIASAETLYYVGRARGDFIFNLVKVILCNIILRLEKKTMAGKL